MRPALLAALAALLAGCPSTKFGDSGDTALAGTCCAFVCADGTEGVVTFTSDADDCSSYASDQCGLAGSTVDDVSFDEAGC